MATVPIRFRQVGSPRLLPRRSFPGLPPRSLLNSYVRLQIPQRFRQFNVLRIDDDPERDRFFCLPGHIRFILRSGDFVH